MVFSKDDDNPITDMIADQSPKKQTSETMSNPPMSFDSTNHLKAQEDMRSQSEQASMMVDSRQSFSQSCLEQDLIKAM